MSKNAHSRWYHASIEKEKQQIQTELAQIADSKKRLFYILRNVKLLQEEEGVTPSIRRFIYAVYALIEHERNGVYEEGLRQGNTHSGI